MKAVDRESAEQGSRRPSHPSSSFRRRQEEGRRLVCRLCCVVVANAPKALRGPAPPTSPLDFSRQLGLSLGHYLVELRGKKNPEDLFLEMRNRVGVRGGFDMDSHPELITQGTGDQQNSACESEQCLPAERERGE